MPRGNIETFTGNIDAPRADERGSSAFEQLGRTQGAIGASIGRTVGGAIGNLGDVYDRHEAIVETTALGKGFADIEVQTKQAEEQAKITGNPHDPDFVKNFMDAQQEKLGALGDDLQTDQGRRLYETLTNNYRTSTTNRLLAWQSSAAAADTMASADKTVTTYANLAQADPTSAKVFVANISAQAASLPVEVRGRWTNQATQTIYDSAGEGIVNRLTSNPSATMKDIEDAKALLADPKGGYVGNMSPAQYASINSRLDKAAETIGSTQSQIDAQVLSAGYAKLKMNGGVDQENALQGIITRYRGASPAATAEFKAKAQREYDDAIEYGRVAKGVNSAPDAEVKEAIQSLREAIKTATPEKAALGEARLKAAEEAKAARDQAFKSDPATWLNQNSDVVKTRYSAFAANQTPQNFQAYAAASSAEQRRLYPNATPNVMSNDMRDTIHSAISKITDDPEGAAAAATILSSYARVAGSYWPGMAQQLFRDKVLKPEQFVAAQLYGKPNATGLAEELLRASAVPFNDLMNRTAGTPGVTFESVRAAANAALAPLASTLRDDRSAPGTSPIDGYERALATLMLYRHTASSGDAKALASSIINDEYVFKGSYRIPNSAKVNADDVSAGLHSALGQIDKENSGIGSPTANLIVPRSYSGLGPNDQARAYVLSIQRNGHWTTNSDETGVLLYDEQGSPVWRNGKDGKPQMVGLNWADAAKAGVSARGTPGKLWKYIWGEK